MEKKDKDFWQNYIIFILIFGAIFAIIMPIVSYESPHEYSSKCIEKVAKCISKNKLDKAEYYIKSFKEAGDKYNDLPSNVIENLVQAYIDNGEVNKAVSLSKWSWQYVGKPVYEYYMLNNEYLVAEEFLEPGVENYSEHLKRVVTNLVLRDEAEKAKKYVVAKSQYFDSVKDKAYKQTVINNLMAIINAE